MATSSTTIADATASRRRKCWKFIIGNQDVTTHGTSAWLITINFQLCRTFSDFTGNARRSTRWVLAVVFENWINTNIINNCTNYVYHTSHNSSPVVRLSVRPSAYPSTSVIPPARPSVHTTERLTFLLSTTCFSNWLTYQTVIYGPQYPFR